MCEKSNARKIFTTGFVSRAFFSVGQIKSFKMYNKIKQEDGCLHHQGDESLMMEATITSETSVNFYQTTLRKNPEDSHLHTRRRENLKSHKIKQFII
jgi:hypothetical protein